MNQILSDNLPISHNNRECHVDVAVDQQRAQMSLSMIMADVTVGSAVVFIDTLDIRDSLATEVCAAVRHLTATKQGVRFQFDQSVYSDLFASLIAAIACPRRHNLETLIDIALVVGHQEAQSPNSHPIRCNEIRTAIRQSGISAGFSVSSLQNRMLELVASSRSAQDLQLVREVLSNISETCNLVVPVGWSLSDEGIENPSFSEQFPIPILITQSFQSQAGKSEVKVEWKRRGRWSSRIVNQSTIASKRSILALAEYGLPVTSTNAATLVDYLNEFALANEPHLPVHDVTNKLGWHEVDSQKVFLCGETVIARDHDNTPVLAFSGGDSGDVQIAEAFYQQGEFGLWNQMIQACLSLPKVMTAIYAALAPPLLKILRAPNFVVSFDGRTSTGKSTVQAIAASCWGDPIINGGVGSSVIHGWDSTRTFIERKANILNGLPLFLDDTKVARNTDVITETIYQYTSGTGRGRGSQTGVATTTRWQGVLISTGEEPITSYSQAGGSRARVVSIWGSPFEGLQNSGQFVVACKDLIQDNFGFAGPAFVNFLVNNVENWDQLRRDFHDLRAQYRDSLDGAVANRMGECFAVLELTARLTTHSILPQHSYNQHLQQVWQMATSNLGEANPGLAAFRFVHMWAQSHRSHFESANAGTISPHNGWLGKWRYQQRDNGEQRPVDLLMIYKHHLEEALEEQGFVPRAILNHWRDEGWIETQCDSGFGYRVRDNGSLISAIAIRVQSLEEIFGIPPAECEQSANGV